jgi:hypothetical protein
MRYPQLTELEYAQQFITHQKSIRKRLAMRTIVSMTVYEERTLRVPRVPLVLSWCSSLTSMSTFYPYQHQRYVM